MRDISVEIDIDAVERAMDGLAMGGSLLIGDRISVADHGRSGRWRGV